MPYRARGRTTRGLLAMAAGLLVVLASLPTPRAARGQQAAATLRPFPVAIAPGNQHRPAAYGDFVVWFDEMYERPVIRANDLRSGAEIPLSRDGALPAGAPAISGTTVVWADRVGETTTTTFPEPHIFAHDLQTRRDFVVSPFGGRQVEPRINGALVVWTDYRDDPE